MSPRWIVMFGWWDDAVAYANMLSKHHHRRYRVTCVPVFYGYADHRWAVSLAGDQS